MDRTTAIEQLSALYESTFGHSPITTTPIEGAGSNRLYIRFTDSNGKSVIGTYGEKIAENDAFIYLSRHFAERHLPVPEILATDSTGYAYLQTDVGNRSLYDLIAASKADGTFPGAMMRHACRALDMLLDVQFKGAEGLDWNRCYPLREMDRTSVMWDLNYFKYCFLKVLGIEMDENALEREFETLANRLTSAWPHPTFQVRDFQSRNIMVDNAMHLIDYQGGRRGTPFYDAASFIWQSRAGFPHDMRLELFERYLLMLRSYVDISPEEGRQQYNDCVLFRTLQTFGTYGLRGLIEHKPMFIQSIPAAFGNVRYMISNGMVPYPEITSVLVKAMNTYRTSHLFIPLPDDRLTVEVGSFSYKKGYPIDDSGNGGGFVFDCRAMHNPGRYAEYRQLTGRDAAVAAFLDERGECKQFVADLLPVVRRSVDRYISRGFTHLSVYFGCTGGQHRSVYCADRMARQLKDAYPAINVIVNHREQHITEVL